ncbi:MAG: D-alanyl-D-alanine carboxypeptidase, partial [Bacteroidota bacterium]
PKVKGTVAQGSEVIRIFNQIGWKWGGNWKSAKDYQHFSQDGG